MVLPDQTHDPSLCKARRSDEEPAPYPIRGRNPEGWGVSGRTKAGKMPALQIRVPTNLRQAHEPLRHHPGL